MFGGRENSIERMHKETKWEVMKLDFPEALFNEDAFMMVPNWMIPHQQEEDVLIFGGYQTEVFSLSSKDTYGKIKKCSKY